MADIIVSPNDVWRSKPVSTGWNVYRSQADIEAGKVLYSFPGTKLLGKFVKDVQNSKGWYSLMDLAIPLEIPSGTFGLTKSTHTQLWIQNQALEKVSLTPVIVKKGSSETGRVNRRTGPSTEFPLITPPLVEGQSAGKTDGTITNGYVVLFTDDNRVQFVAKTYLSSVGQLEQSTIDSFANNVETGTSWIDFSLLIKSVLVGFLAIGIGWGFGYLMDRNKRKTAL